MVFAPRSTLGIPVGSVLTLQLRILGAVAPRFWSSIYVIVHG
jgi:hypothetical protein